MLSVGTQFLENNADNQRFIHSIWYQKRFRFNHTFLIVYNPLQKSIVIQTDTTMEIPEIQTSFTKDPTQS